MLAARHDDDDDDDDDDETIDMDFVPVTTSVNIGIVTFGATIICTYRVSQNRCTSLI